VALKVPQIALNSLQIPRYSAEQVAFSMRQAETRTPIERSATGRSIKNVFTGFTSRRD
jgi:hypothetical protein